MCFSIYLLQTSIVVFFARKMYSFILRILLLSRSFLKLSFEMRSNRLIQITLVLREKANYEVNYKTIKTVSFFVTTYLVGRSNSHHVPRVRQTASTKHTLREHDTERYYWK